MMILVYVFAAIGIACELWAGFNNSVNMPVIAAGSAFALMAFFIYLDQKRRNKSPKRERREIPK